VTNVTACIKEFEALAEDDTYDYRSNLIGDRLRLNNFESLCVLGDIKRTRYGSVVPISQAGSSSGSVQVIDAGQKDAVAASDKDWLPPLECCGKNMVYAEADLKSLFDPKTCPSDTQYRASDDYQFAGLAVDRDYHERDLAVAGFEHMVVMMYLGRCSTFNPQDWTLRESTVDVSFAGGTSALYENCASNDPKKALCGIPVHDRHTDFAEYGDSVQWETRQVSEMLCAVVGSFNLPRHKFPPEKCYPTSSVEFKTATEATCGKLSDFSYDTYSTLDTKGLVECWAAWQSACTFEIKVLMKMSDAMEQHYRDTMPFATCEKDDSYKGLYDGADVDLYYDNICLFENALERLWKKEQEKGNSKLNCREVRDEYKALVDGDADLDNKYYNDRVKPLCDSDGIQYSFECFKQCSLLEGLSVNSTGVTGVACSACEQHQKWEKHFLDLFKYMHPSLDATHNEAFEPLNDPPPRKQEECKGIRTYFSSWNDDNECTLEHVKFSFGFNVPRQDAQTLSAITFEGSTQYADYMKASVGDASDRVSGHGLTLRGEATVLKRSGCNVPAGGSCSDDFPFHQEVNDIKYSLWPMNGQKGCIAWAMQETPTIKAKGISPGLFSMKISALKLSVRKIDSAIEKKLSGIVAFDPFLALPFGTYASVYVTIAKKSVIDREAEFIRNGLTQEASEGICMYRFMNDTYQINYEIGEKCGDWDFDSEYDDYPYVNVTYTLYACDGVCDMGDESGTRNTRTKGSLMRSCRQVSRRTVAVRADEDVQGRDLEVRFENFGEKSFELSPVVSANAELDFTSTLDGTFTGELFIDLTKQFVRRPQVCPVSALSQNLPCEKRGTLLKLVKETVQILTFDFEALHPSDINTISITSSTLDFYTKPDYSAIGDCAAGDDVCDVSSVVEDARDDPSAASTSPLNAYRGFVAKLNFSALPNDQFNTLSEKCKSSPCTVKITLRVETRDRRRRLAASNARFTKTFFVPLMVPEIKARFSFFEPAAACRSDTISLMQSVATLAEEALGCKGCVIQSSLPTKTSSVIGMDARPSCAMVDITVQIPRVPRDVEQMLKTASWASRQNQWDLQVVDVDMWDSSQAGHDSGDSTSGDLSLSSPSSISDDEATAQWTALGAAAIMGVVILGSARHFARKRTRFKVASEASMKSYVA
jgi:hypothetical protein